MSQQINLFNPIFMKQRKYFSLLAMLQALGLIVAGALLFYGYAIDQVGELRVVEWQREGKLPRDEIALDRLPETPGGHRQDGLDGRTGDAL